MKHESAGWMELKSQSRAGEAIQYTNLFSIYISIYISQFLKLYFLV